MLPCSHSDFTFVIIITQAYNNHVHHRQSNRDRPIHLPQPPPHLHPHALALRSPFIDSDHYNSIMQSWDYGPIYSSEITKKLMMTKYPKLMDKVSIIPYGSWHTIEINEERARLMAIDSNHMAGSIMVMIHYRQKYYLHTGDMRFNKKIVENCPQIFEKIDEINYRCRFPV